jgi:Trypsin-like peptidase domain
MVSPVVLLCTSAFLSLTLLAGSALLHAQSITIATQSVGTLADAATGAIAGTAFVAGKNPRLITCWHVGTVGDPRADKLYRSASSPGTPSFVSTVKPVSSSQGYDLESFEIQQPLNFTPLQFGETKSIHPGDRVFYIGFLIRDGSLQVNWATVSSVGSELNDGVITDFLEFEGVGVPGFSGGPVFDINGKVVALMREAWTKRGLQPGASNVLVNRAFSTDTIKKLDDQESVGHKEGAAPKQPQ